MNISRHRTLKILLCACFIALPAPYALSESGSTVTTRGEIIRDTARLTFEWQHPIEFSVSEKDKKITLNFERKIDVDAASVLSGLYPFITSIDKAPSGKAVTLTLDKHYKIRKFNNKNIGGIELVGIAENPADKKTVAALPAENEKNIMPLLPYKTAQNETAEKLAALAPAAGEESAKKEPKPESEQASDSNPSSAPSKDSEYKMQINKVAVSYAEDSATLRFPLAQRSPFAVFVRNHRLWVVIGKPIKLDLSDFEDISKTVLKKPEVIANSKAAILYIPIDDNIFVNVTKEGNSDNVAILLTQKRTPLAAPLDVEVNTAPPVAPHVLIPTLEPSEPIATHDPVIGDPMIIIPLYKTGEGIGSSRNFIDFDLPATAQGIAVVTKTDDVSTIQLRNGIRITAAKGATISENLPKLDPKAANEGLQSNPTLFPYEMWKLKSDESRIKQLQKLFHRIVEAGTPQDANNARLQTAQIYLGEGLAPEAIALLDGINRTDPSFYRSAKLNALRGAGNFLMSRFIDSAKDFSSAELNNNKEIEYWRAVLSELLGNSGQSYDFLAMEEDYINKYPPLFRQRLGIVAADHAIAAKDYNAALKIFDSLHRDHLIDSIDAYINFLMAKISMFTGQDKEATESLDKLADDYKHPFIKSRAEFTRIARDMDAGATPDKIIDRLEKLRLTWHGDNLELQVLTLLGELYNDKKDYVNAMRVWNNGVEGFKNTAAAIDMARKMEEVFIIMFNDGTTDKLSPLEALALYYEYRNYMPGGTAGSEMTDRLADRLISVDLLEQAATLLDREMKGQAEKEKRSKIGAKLAGIYLMNRQPQKAITALQDSVYGENPVLLRLLRNQLAAEAILAMDKPDLALQTLGQDDSNESERVRAKIYWKTKDRAKLIATIENLLKRRPDITAPLTIAESELLIKLALSYILTENKEQLGYLYDYYNPLMQKNPNYEIFKFLASPDVVPNSRNFDEVIKKFDDTRSFVANYKARIKEIDNIK